MDVKHWITQAVRSGAAQGSTMAPRQWGVLGIGAMLGLMLWWVGWHWQGSWRLSGLFGVFIATHAGIIAAGSLPDQWLSRRLDALLDRWVRDESGGGFYGMVALSVFFGLELESLLDPEDGLLSGWSFVEGQLMQHVLGFSIDSIRHAISAAIWPWRLVSVAGLVPAAVTVAACWGVFSLARFWLPMPDLRKRCKVVDEPPAS